MSNTLEHYEADMLIYETYCALHGITYSSESAEDYAESVARRIYEGESENDARFQQFKDMHSVFEISSDSYDFDDGDSDVGMASHS